MAVLIQIGINRAVDCIKISNTFSSMFLSCTSSAIPEILRYSHLHYCSLAWHFHSWTFSFSDSLSFTFLKMSKPYSSLQNLVFSSLRSFFSLFTCLPNPPRLIAQETIQSETYLKFKKHSPKFQLLKKLLALLLDWYEMNEKWIKNTSTIWIHWDILN